MSQHPPEDNELNNDNELPVAESGVFRQAQSFITRYYPMLYKVIIASAIFHFLFIYYFPLDFLDRLFFHEESVEEQTSPTPDPMQIVFSPGSTSGMPPTQPNDSVDDEGEKNAEQGMPQGIDQDKWGDLLERLQKNTGFQQGYVQTYEDMISQNRPSNAYIFRDRKHEDIVIKDVFPTIHDIEKPFEEILKNSQTKLKDYTERNEIVDEYRDRLTASKARLKVNIEPEIAAENPGALHFPPTERQQYFDKTLKEDKSKQLGDFIQKYFKYDPNKGDLPIATRELYYQNLERLLYVFSNDPSYFYLDFYLENLNKEDFMFNALIQASILDGSKTATELLFILQEIYEIQQRAWKVYFDFKKIKEQIPPEKRNRLRVETLRRVDERYQPVLAEKNIKDFTDIQQKYSQRRLEIIEYIIKNTPDAYRIPDARFTRASILWEMGMLENNQTRINQAINTWQSLLQQADQNRFTSDELKEFTHLPFLKNLQKYLINYQKAPAELKAKQASNITLFLRQRATARIVKKGEREKRLLWPGK